MIRLNWFAFHCADINGPATGGSTGGDGSITEALDQLFKDAQGSFNYTLTLLRVGGIEAERDQLLQLADGAAEILGKPADDLITDLRRLLALDAPLHLLSNLLNSAAKVPYNPFPFQHLIKGTSYPFQQPTQREKVEDLLNREDLRARPVLKEIIQSCYLDHGLLESTPRIDLNQIDQVRALAQRCAEFWSALTSRVQAARQAFGTKNQLVKWPQFEVLEVLCRDPEGLSGFRVYFSNGSHAEFTRYPDHTFSLNLIVRDTVNFMAGDLDALRPEWRIGEKRLYEIGLPGRYNELGQWKPMTYPGPTESLMKEIVAASTDPDVQGAMFYMFCTGHRIMEFVVRASLDLPIDQAVNFGSTIHPVHLWKCPRPATHPSSVTVYDGWVVLQTGSPEEIGDALLRVGIALNRLAFAFGADLSWRLKYSNRPMQGGTAAPTKEDLPYLDHFLTDIPYVLDFAIDWYNRGRNSRNIFTGFLCFFVAMEVIVEAVYSDEEIDIEIGKKDKATRREERVKCIHEKYKALYESDPARFVQEAYFECVQTLKARRREVCELVFGKGHSNLKALFQPPSPDEKSLEDIRNDVAHGKISHIDQAEIDQVRERLYEIASIAKEFIIRVLLKLRPDQPTPGWSGTHVMSMSTSDPRDTFVTNNLEIFPNKDWTIQPEWCE